MRAIRLSRNFGQQIAITAGLAHAQGRFVVVMDCDLQDPPETIPELWRSACAGNDIVFASRVGGDPKRRRFLNRLYFHVMAAATGYRIDPGQGSFSMISRKAVDAFLQFSEKERHYLFILRWLGFTTSSITYERHDRTIGQSSYTFASLIKHSIQGFFFQSTAPLLWIMWTGLVCAGFSMLSGLFFLVNALRGTPPEGFTALIVVQLLIGGLLLTGIGTVGLYIARIFDSVKRRPLYAVDLILGEGHEGAAATTRVAEPIAAPLEPRRTGP
ncbi:glycosyltransferase involved in cell wall biosynthesis [Bosea sp. OAE506]